MNNIDFSQMITAETRARCELDDVKAVARTRIAALLNTFDMAQTGEIPLAERTFWGPKLIEAQAVLAGGTSKMLALEAAETGEDIKVLAQMVLDRAAQYQTMAARITGWRRNALTTVETATTPAEATAALHTLVASLSDNPA